MGLPDYKLPGGAEKTDTDAALNFGFQYGQSQAEIRVLGEDGKEPGVPFAIVNGNVRP